MTSIFGIILCLRHNQQPNQINQDQTCWLQHPEPLRQRLTSRGNLRTHIWSHQGHKLGTRICHPPCQGLLHPVIRTMRGHRIQEAVLLYRLDMVLTGNRTTHSELLQYQVRGAPPAFLAQKTSLLFRSVTIPRGIRVILLDLGRQMDEIPKTNHYQKGFESTGRSLWGCLESGMCGIFEMNVRWWWGKYSVIEEGCKKTDRRQVDKRFSPVIRRRR